MAPAKNPHNTNNNNINSNNNATTRKQTGTVPKSATTTTKRLGGAATQSGLQQQQPPQQQQSRCSSSLNVVASMQQQQRQQIVAPIRRELKDLNDLLSTVVTNTTTTANTISSSNGSNNQHHHQQQQQQQQPALNGQQKLRLQNISNNNNTSFQKQPQQQQQHFNDNNFEIENLSETQRFCYPVRPIPRRNQQQQHQQLQQPNDNTTIALNTNLLNHAATIGIVIPTTPSLASNTTTDAAAAAAAATASALINYNQQQQQQQQQHQQQLQQQLLLLQLQQLIEEPLNPSNQQQQHNSLLPTNLLDLAASFSSSSPSASALAASNCNLSDSPALLQRLQLIQHFFNLTPSIKKTSNSSGSRIVEATANFSTTNPLRDSNQLHRTKMVHEINPNTAEHDVIVNSASLEDVALSEMSDNRAQSIQSLHSVLETPTPDNTPSYDDLQERLETSNRNIHNMQEQQQQLLRLQNAAKQHLNEMEELRQHAGQLSFGGATSDAMQQQQQNGAPPNYESIEQVHSDMASLVGRMKNLTTFIQNQNELSTLLGDDGPEILAEQEALQRKLESLRTQRDEMRHLVDELQDINRDAERSAAKENRYRDEDDDEEKETDDVVAAIAAVEKSTAINAPQQAAAPVSERVVPVEYSRIVPIELLQAAAAGDVRRQQHEPQTIDDDERAPTAEESLVIQQKVADIEAMKAQLKRLKDMMETVNLIETHNAARPDPKQVGRTTPQTRDTRSQSSSFDRDRTPTAVAVPCGYHSPTPPDNEEDAFISRKVRMLNDVTSDLRAQAESLQAERDRIKALKEEIIRRKAQAAAAAQLGEDALKRHSLTPTPTPSMLHHHRQQLDEEQTAEADRDQLKAEYETKKKEFEQLCRQLQQEDSATTSATPTLTHNVTTTTRRHEIVSEADDEAEEELNDSDYATANNNKYYAAAADSAPQAPTLVSQPTRCSTVAAVTSTHGKESSLNSTVASTVAATTCDGAATTATGCANSTHDGGSLEAASMQSGSTRSFSIPPAMAPMCSSNWPGPIPPPLPSSWNPHFYYGAGLSAPPPPPPPQAVGPYTPPHYSLLHHGHGASSMAAASSVVPPLHSDCICNSATNSAATLGGAGGGGAPGTASSSASAAAQLASSDPVLLQQFVQTQQMLINSVCQCNQMLWHQQREIDSLNNTIHMLQDRLYTLSGPSAADLSFNLRSESVPPPSLTGGAALPNNLYASIASGGHNRAQSEQPLAPQPAFVSSGARSAFANYHQQQQQQLHQQQQQHFFQQRQRGIGGGGGGVYNYSTETQQQHQQNVSSAASTSIYATLNNANVAPPQQQQFNNEAPQSPMAGAGGPGPIFMHHHNNSIHQNNANLRTQNHHANNLQQQQQQQHNNAANNNTLNNQVPPGNRANNFWDNFRSYSRQNLLSTNSHKSNEDQQQHLQQQQQHEHEEQYHLQRPALTQNLRHHHLQRSRINQLQQQQQYQQQQQQQQQQNISNMLHTNLSNLYQRDFLENLNWPETADDLYGNYNIVDTDLAGTYPTAGGVGDAPTPSNLRTMNNINFGNSPHYQRNKVLAKPPCRAATTTPTAATSLNRNRTQQQQHQTHLRNVDEFAISQQQQQRPPHFRNAPPFTGVATSQNQEHFGMLPTISANVAGGGGGGGGGDGSTNHFLLRTVDVANVAAATATDYVYMPDPTTEATENAAGDEFGDDDDTTSEEIKRNLLVNALKNDKFTTKFYESIKEDVFRRLESMLLEKESSDRQRSEQQSTPPKQQFLTQLFNDVGGNASYSRLGVGSAERDPMRKLHLNARMSGNQQPQCFLQPTLQQLQLEVDHNKEREEEDDEDANNNADTESNNADNEDATIAAAEPTLETVSDVTEIAIPVESEKPEEDDSERFNKVLTSAVAIAERTKVTTKWRKNVTSGINTRQLDPLPQPLVTMVGNKNPAKKRKNQRSSQRNCNELNELVLPPPEQGAFSLAAQLQNSLSTAANQASDAPSNTNSNNASPPPPNQSITTTSVDYDLINYIITRIKNQTHANTLINDTLLVEIAKLTATAAQNSAASKLATAPQPPPPNISPKKIYAKIKKLSVPRQRDEFLVWYQNYLETLFPIAVAAAAAVNMEQIAADTILSVGSLPLHHEQTNRKLQKSNIPIKSKVNEDVVPSKQLLPNVREQHGSNAIDSVANLQINDGDLAEADQNSANTSSNTSTMLQHDQEDNADDKRDGAADDNDDSTNIVEMENDLAAAAQIKNEIDELENNENPEEEGGGAGAVSVVDNEEVADLQPQLQKQQHAADFADSSSGGFVKRNGLA